MESAWIFFTLWNYTFIFLLCISCCRRANRCLYQRRNSKKSGFGNICTLRGSLSWTRLILLQDAISWSLRSSALHWRLYETLSCLVIWSPNMQIWFYMNIKYVSSSERRFCFKCIIIRRSIYKIRMTTGKVQNTQTESHVAGIKPACKGDLSIIMIIFTKFTAEVLFAFNMIMYYHCETLKIPNFKK